MAVRRWSRIARMSCLALTVVLVACMGVGTDLVADQKAVVTATLDTTLFPKSIAGTQAAAVVITVDAAQRVERASLKIDAPPGFAAAPDAFALGTVERKTIQKAVLTRTDDHAVDGDRPLVVTLSAATEGTPPVVIAAQTATFSYAAQIAARSYLLLGGIGIALGYALRFFVNILKSLPTPVPAPEEGVAAAGPITEFVRRHYYATDFLITFGLAMIALVALMQGTKPPQTAATWPHALTLGVSLGLLTNSELFTRIR